MESSIPDATHLTARPDRIQYLEGLRGVAAIQVVLLHFVTGFLPMTMERAPPRSRCCGTAIPRSMCFS